MANSLTAIFTSLLALPDLDRNRIAELLQRNDKKPMQTTSLRLRPGTRQLIDELSGKIGISQSELLNMVIEGSFRDIFLPFSNTAISVIDRFELLMQSHELSPTDIAELLSSWNVRVSVLQDRERTMDYLSTPLLQALADWFSFLLAGCLEATFPCRHRQRESSMATNGRNFPGGNYSFSRK